MMDDLVNDGCYHEARCGVNIDGHGDTVGLWFEAEDVEVNEHAYVFMEPAALGVLGIEMARAADTPGVDRVAVAVYGGGDYSRSAFVAVSAEALHEQLGAEVVRPWVEEHAAEAEDVESMFYAASTLLAAGEFAAALELWGDYQAERDTGEWVEVLGEVAIYGRPAA